MLGGWLFNSKGGGIGAIALGCDVRVALKRW